jgi:hypothetical protein
LKAGGRPGKAALDEPLRSRFRLAANRFAKQEFSRKLSEIEESWRILRPRELEAYCAGAN